MIMETDFRTTAAFLTKENTTADKLAEYLEYGMLAVAVRCKDCDYWQYNGGTCGRIYRPDGFCSEGRRKES